MKKAFSLILALVLLCGLLAGCSSSPLDPENPVTLTMWHNYGGDMQATMDYLIDQFNSTVGKEKGIIINVEAISSGSELNESLAMIANDGPGAPDMPDIFTGYPKVAIQFQEKGKLANPDEYFTEDELSKYVDEFVAEGRLSDGGLYVFPIAKSTEVLYVNMTLFNEFAAATGASADDLATFEGIARLSKSYYDWCGKQFFASDAWFNFFEVGMAQKGSSIFNGEALSLDNETFDYIFNTIYTPSVEGGIAVYDGYSSDLSKTGDIVCSTGSSAGILFYGDTITYADGTVFGLCGIEVSDRLFKSVYTPEGGSFENIFTVMAPVCEDGLCTSKGLLAGNSYLTGKQWQFDLSVDGTHDGFTHYAGGEELYAGKSKSIRLYPNASPYAEEAWSISVLMPHRILHSAVEGNSNVFLWTVVALLAVSLVVSFFVSRRYIKPVNDALDSIRSIPHEERKKTAYTEINDLFEYLAAKDREHEDEVQRLHGERAAVQNQYEQVQTYVTHLADERMPEVNEDDFEMFLKHLHTLTPKEREIFDHYLAGKKAKEIMELAAINQNTLKYHNKNIYSKLGVTSRKQLLEYAALMKYRKED